MKKILSLLFSLLFTMTLMAQLNMTKLGQLAYTPNLNDVWGYVDTLGNEYALVGAYDAFSVVDVTDPANPVEKWSISGPGSTWRDIMTYGHYAYVSNETSDGILIVDMSSLPDTNFTTYRFTGTNYPFNSAHNVFIDENGVLYVIGADYGNGGAIMLDLASNPVNPPELGVVNQYYFHDAVVRGDTLWGSAVYDGFFAVIDVSNRSSPTVLGTAYTPSQFTHNAWYSDNNNYLYTTDEVSNGFIGAFDVSDVNNLHEIDRIQSSPGQNVIPHNTHWINKYLVTSYYTDGVVITDVAQPDNIINTGYYDTSPSYSGDGFNGCWGVYPWLPSGNILATDIEEGLLILGVTYQRAAYLRGNVTEKGTSNIINGVKVELLGETADDLTDLSGDYATGLAVAGTHDVKFSKAGYDALIVSSVQIFNDSTIILDVELDKAISVTLSGRVVENKSGDGIDQAFVKFENDTYTYNATTDANGDFSINDFYPADYTMISGKWGYITKCTKDMTIHGSSSPEMRLNEGIYDDFTFNFGWNESGNATAGLWERGEPKGTTFNGKESNPEEDVQGDCSDKALVTGNAGGQVGQDDIDDGATNIESPIFNLAGYGNPVIFYHRWFFNDGGQGSPNDSLEVFIDNGSGQAKLETVNANSQDNSTWVSRNYRVKNFISTSSTMTVKARAMDNASGHLVEAGFDFFYILDSAGAPIADFSADKVIICEGSIVQFSNESLLGDTYLWTFTGGFPLISSNMDETVTYNSAGSYDVQLITINGNGSDTLLLKDYIEVVVDPVASFTINSPIDLALNETADPVDGSTGAEQYVWTFGDGGSSTMAVPSYAYGSSGTYEVCQVVVNDCASDTICDSVTVICSNPKAAMTVADSGAFTQFVDASTFNPTSWHWDFGDGTTDTAQNPQHTYASNDAYQVCLSIENRCGVDTLCQSVNVQSVGVKEEIQLVTNAIPNPTDGMINISWSSQELANIEIVNVMGEIALSKTLIASLDINTSTFANGIYFYSISIKGKESVKAKFEVVH